MNNRRFNASSSSSSSCGSWLFLVLLLLVTWMPWESLAQENRTTVQLEYKLQVNFTDAIPTIDDALAAVESTTKTLLLNVLASSSLGGNSSSNSDNSNTANEVILQSNLQDRCYDSTVPSDVCFTVSTVASILVPPGVNPAMISVATTNQRVQTIWWNDIHTAYPDVIQVSSIPSTSSVDNVEALFTVRLQHVTSIMNENQIAIFEASVLESLVDAVADTNFTYLSLHSVKVISQTLVESSRRRQLRLLQSPFFDNVVNTTVSGNCRDCTSNQFSNTIDDAVDSPNFQKKLKENGQSGSSSGNATSYFDTITNTSATVSSVNGIRNRDSGTTTTGGGASSSYSDPNSSESKAPDVLWIILAVCGVIVAVFIIALLTLSARRRRQRAEEAEGEESPEECRRDDYDHQRHRPRRSDSYRKPSDVTDHDDDGY